MFVCLCRVDLDKINQNHIQMLVGQALVMDQLIDSGGSSDIPSLKRV